MDNKWAILGATGKDLEKHPRTTPAYIQKQITKDGNGVCSFEEITEVLDELVAMGWLITDGSEFNVGYRRFISPSDQRSIGAKYRNGRKNH